MEKLIEPVDEVPDVDDDLLDERDDDDLDDADDVEENVGLAQPTSPVREGGPTELVVIRPTAGWRSVNFGELWRFRELLFFLSWRDVRVRYKQTVLGFGWAVIQPVMTMIVFNVVFGKFGGMDKKVEFAAYPVFLYSALLPWTFFSGAVASGGVSLIASERLISKVYFPRLLIPFAAVATQLVDFAISFVVMLGLLAYYHVTPSWNLLLVPILTVGATVAAMGAATLLSALSIAYRDFRYVIPFFMQLWMFACPVPYQLDAVPEKWRLVYALNPMAGMIDGFRSALLARPFHWDVMTVSFASTLVLSIVGMSYFRRVERRFADIV